MLRDVSVKKGWGHLVLVQEINCSCCMRLAISMVLFQTRCVPSSAPLHLLLAGNNGVC